MTEETVVEEVEEEVVEEVEVEENPHQDAIDAGWKDRDEWIEGGGDPDMWTGPGYFMKWKSRESQRLEDVRARDKKIDVLTGQVKGMVKTFAQTASKQTEKHIAELEAAKTRAKEDLDLPAYVEAEKKLNNIETTPPQEPEVVQKFRTSVPQLDMTNSEFNASFDAAVSMRVNIALMEVTGGNRAATNDEMESILQKQTEAVKGDFPHLFKQKKQRKAPGMAEPGGKKASSAVKMEDWQKELHAALLDNSPDAAAYYMEELKNG